MKPPSFMMLTPNGRFQTSAKICLSISSHHPEHWQPSWSVRTALVALTAFMPTPGNGAIGSLVSTSSTTHKPPFSAKPFMLIMVRPALTLLARQSHANRQIGKNTGDK